MKNILSSFYYPLMLMMLCATAVGCEGSNNISDVVVYVPSSQYSISTKSGNIEVFNINASANKGTLSNLCITEQSSSSGLVTILDQELSGSSYSLDFQYSVPEINSQSEEVYLKIKVTNSDQSSSTIKIVVDITGSSTITIASTDITLYGAATGAYNGYSFFKEQLVSIDATDSCYIDLYDYPNEADLNELSLEWRSMSGVVFARLSGFDFGSATTSSITTGYNIAVKLDKVTAISNEDVIFIGLDSQTPLAVIKVNNIYDNEGYLNDRYSLSMKVLDVEYPDPKVPTTSAD